MIMAAVGAPLVAACSRPRPELPRAPVPRADPLPLRGGAAHGRGGDLHQPWPTAFSTRTMRRRRESGRRSPRAPTSTWAGSSCGFPAASCSSSRSRSSSSAGRWRGRGRRGLAPAEALAAGGQPAGSAALAWLTVGALSLVMTLGNVVSATGSGLGCPDWPLCHGRVIPPGGAESHRVPPPPRGATLLGAARGYRRRHLAACRHARAEASRRRARRPARGADRPRGRHRAAGAVAGGEHGASSRRAVRAGRAHDPLRDARPARARWRGAARRAGFDLARCSRARRAILPSRSSPASRQPGSRCCSSSWRWAGMFGTRARASPVPTSRSAAETCSPDTGWAGALAAPLARRGAPRLLPPPRPGEPAHRAGGCRRRGGRPRGRPGDARHPDRAAAPAHHRARRHAAVGYALWALLVWIAVRAGAWGATTGPLGSPSARASPNH